MSRSSDCVIIQRRLKTGVSELLNLEADLKHTRKNEIRNHRQQQASNQDPFGAVALVTLPGLF